VQIDFLVAIPFPSYFARTGSAESVLFDEII
jgi:hypothetical protein